MTVLAHVSDVHLGPLPPFRTADLIGKRALGYVNWKRNRERIYSDAVRDALMVDLAAKAPDHIVVTGDLVNLALDAEFDNALAWLRALGPPDRVTVIPGNHDAYVRGAPERLATVWRAYVQGDGRAGVATFPFTRRREGIALIGVSTAVPTAPFMATGRVGREQADALARILSGTGRKGLIRVVLIHHPPVAGAMHWHRRLIDARRIRDIVAAEGVELILHGHNHVTSVAELAGPRGPIPVVGAAATALRPRPGHAAGAYNLIDINGTREDLTITLTVRGITPGGAVETLFEQTLVSPA